MPTRAVWAAVRGGSTEIADSHETGQGRADDIALRELPCHVENP